MPPEISWISVGRGALGLTALPVTAAHRTAIAQAGPALILSLTEDAEWPEVTQTPFAGSGAAHLRFPIPDYGIPSPQADWPALSIRLHDTLQGGGRIVIHCWGGRGRSGMIALRLMVSLGEDPVAALARLRAARPGAVETPAQEDWARQG